MKPFLIGWVTHKCNQNYNFNFNIYFKLVWNFNFYVSKLWIFMNYWIFGLNRREFFRIFLFETSIHNSVEFIDHEQNGGHLIRSTCTHTNRHKMRGKKAKCIKQTLSPAFQYYIIIQTEQTVRVRQNQNVLN